MPQVRNIITDFKAGELDPALRMRTDTKAYASGGKTVRNAIIHNSGSVSDRPGSLKLIKLADQSQLREFEFDADEKYVFAFQSAQVVIYDEEGTLLTTVSSAPWTVDNMRQMQIAQLGDVMFITHRDFQMRIITRTGASTFVLSTFDFDAAPDGKEHYQPYIKFEAAAHTLALSASSGSGITVTASAAVFTSDYVNTYIRIHGVELLITAYTSSTVVTATAVNTIRQKMDANPFATADGTTTVEVTHVFHGLVTGASVTIAGSGDVGGIGKGNINGARTITVIDEDHYTFAAGASATSSADGGGTVVYITSTAATRDWEEQVFSTVRGWPGAVCFHEDRLCFGGTVELPNGLWLSQTGKYKNFDVDEGQDDASIQTTLGSTRISSIRHVVSNAVLQVFSEGAEFVVRANDDVALTPANVSSRVMTPYGSSYVTPKVFDGATLFIQANDRAVREFIEDATQNRFTAVDVSTLSPHLINAPIDFAVVYGTTTRPEQYAFIINSDGTMAVFHSIRSEGLAAWVPWTTREDDLFDSVCVLGQKVFLSVYRDGDYWLEKIDFDGDCTLDFAKRMTAAPTVTWALGSDYASKVVHVTSGNYYLGEFTANGAGTITLLDQVTQIHAGFDIDFELEILPVEVLLQDGSAAGQWKRINSVIAHVLDTLSIEIEGRAIATRRAGSTIDLSVEPTALSGKYKVYLLGFDRDRSIVVTRRAPLPIHLIGLVLEVIL